MEPEEHTATRRGTALISSAALALVVGLFTSAFQIAGVVDMAMAHLLMALAWLVAVLAVCFLPSHEYTVRFRSIGVVLVTVLLGGADLWMVRKRAALDLADVRPQLSLQSEKAPYSFIPQDNQPARPKARRFARIMVTAEGKSVANVRASVSKINDADQHLRLYLSSIDTLFQFPQSFRLEESVNLNAGDGQYFDVLIECNGTVCPDGSFAIPSIENGQRFFSVLSEGGGDVKPRSLTIRATGDGVVPVMKDFLILLEGGKLLLKP